MRILACISEDFYFLSHRKELLLGLISAGYQVELATNFTTREEAVRESGIPVHQVNLKRKSLSPFSVCAGALAYRRLINRLAPDLVFAVALKPILAARLCRFLGI